MLKRDMHTWQGELLCIRIYFTVHSDQPLITSVFVVMLIIPHCWAMYTYRFSGPEAFNATESFTLILKALRKYYWNLLCNLFFTHICCSVL